MNPRFRLELKAFRSSVNEFRGNPHLAVHCRDSARREIRPILSYIKGDVSKPRSHPFSQKYLKLNANKTSSLQSGKQTTAIKRNSNIHAEPTANEQIRFFAIQKA